MSDANLGKTCIGASLGWFWSINFGLDKKVARVFPANSACSVVRPINKLPAFLCVSPAIDHEFCHHIVKVAVDRRGDSRVDPQTTLTRL